MIKNHLIMLIFRVYNLLSRIHPVVGFDPLKMRHKMFTYQGPPSLQRAMEP